MYNKLFYSRFRYTLRNNGELAYGLLSLLCFYTIVISSLMHNIFYFSVFYEADEYWPNFVWKAGLFFISIFTLLSCYKKIFLFYASIFSHMLLLYHYNLFSVLSFNSVSYFRIYNFSLWWISLLTSLQCLRLASKKYNIGNGLLNVYIFICMLIGYYRGG